MQLEAKSEAQEPLRIELDDAFRADLTDRIKRFREALEDFKDG